MSRAYPIPQISRQPATVDYIDNQLPKHHELFDDPPVEFDVVSQQFVTKPQHIIPKMSDDDAVVLRYNSDDALDDYGIPPRPAITNFNAMKLWKSIMPHALDKFRETKAPKDRDAAFSIRDKDDWDAIYNTLESAQKNYTSEKGKFGSFRRLRRKMADKAGVVGEVPKAVLKTVPNNPYSTPVLCAVELLLDAVKTAAMVREEVLQGFDGLVAIFSDAEFLLATYPKDSNILNASIGLTVAVLNAIEQAIGFFIRNEIVKGLKAIGTGSGYEETLRKSLKNIEEKSRALMKEADKSHLRESHLFSVEGRRFLGEIRQGFRGVQNTFNDVHIFLRDLYRQNENLTKLVEQTQRQTFAQGVLFGRATSPFQPHHVQRFINQDTLRQILVTSDLDITDIRFIYWQQIQFGAKERALAEQIVRTSLFCDWIVRPYSAKLLVHWDFDRPKIFAGLSALSVFCANMVKSLRTQQNFVSAVWFCGRHTDQDEPGQAVGGLAMLTSLIDQLLRQYSFDTGSLDNNIDPGGIHAKKLEVLLNLLEWLLIQLPSMTTAFFIIDGVSLFESEEFQGDAMKVFQRLISLSGSTGISARIKLLLTSTPGTDVVKYAFQQEDLILNVHTLPKVASVPSEERMFIEIEGQFIE